MGDYVKIFPQSRKGFDIATAEMDGDLAKNLYTGIKTKALEYLGGLSAWMEIGIAYWCSSWVLCILSWVALDVDLSGIICITGIVKLWGSQVHCANN